MGSYGIINIGIYISYLVGKPHHLSLKGFGASFRLMVSDAVYHFVCEIKSLSVLFKLFNYPDRLL